jgi:hypothetical protein
MMNYAIAEDVFEQVESSSLESLRESVIAAAARYAAMRSKWHLETGEGRRAMDAERTRAHDAFIDSCNILSRNQAKNGEDNSWRSTLGDNRKPIGDFACYLNCIIGIRAR